MKLKLTKDVGDLVFTLSLAAVIVWMLVEASDWGAGARLFPFAIGGSMLVGLGGQAVLSTVRLVRQATAPEHETDPEEDAWQQRSSDQVRRRVLTTVVTVVVIVLMMRGLGFAFGGALGIALYLRLIAKESWILTISVVLGVLAFFWAIVALLNVPFPDPWLEALPNWP